jgi:hypothetical protein
MSTYNLLETINNKMLQQSSNQQHNFYDVTCDDLTWVVMQFFNYVSFQNGGQSGKGQTKLN